MTRSTIDTSATSSMRTGCSIKHTSERQKLLKRREEFRKEKSLFSRLFLVAGARSRHRSHCRPGAIVNWEKERRKDFSETRRAMWNSNGRSCESLKDQKDDWV